MPYGYFQLVRFAALIGFAILAYKANKQGRKTETIIYVCLGILFQPLVKIALGRQIWNIVDVVVRVALLVSLFMRPSFHAAFKIKAISSINQDKTTSD